MTYPKGGGYTRRDTTGPISRADIERCAPPPDWTAKDQAAFDRAWARPHKSSPTQDERRAAQLDRIKREAEAMTSADQWREHFAERQR